MAVDVEQFSKEPIYRASLPCTQVLEDLQRLSELDDLKEKQQARASAVATGTLAAGVLCMFVGFFLLDGEGIAAVLGWAGAVLALVGVIALVMRSRYQRLNLENRRYQLASRMVGLLQADIAPDEPVTLELDLRPETHPDKYANES
ncbi:MAG TPA: hypothetical protein VGB96_09980, partial [Archangium sp.]